MRLAVGAIGALLVGSLDQAEDLAIGLVHPVLLVVDAVLALDLEVSLVGSGDVLGLDPRNVVHIHVRGHSGRSSCSGWPLIIAGEARM